MKYFALESQKEKWFKTIKDVKANFNPVSQHDFIIVFNSESPNNFTRLQVANKKGEWFDL